MRTSPDREEIDTVMAETDVSGIDDLDERNLARRHAVETYLDNDETYNLDAAGPASSGLTIREMILDDLPSYPSWEKS